MLAASPAIASSGNFSLDPEQTDHLAESRPSPTFRDSAAAYYHEKTTRDPHSRCRPTIRAASLLQCEMIEAGLETLATGSLPLYTEFLGEGRRLMKPVWVTSPRARRNALRWMTSTFDRIRREVGREESFVRLRPWHRGFRLIDLAPGFDKPIELVSGLPPYWLARGSKPLQAS
jgi:hypothetical protein